MGYEFTSAIDQVIAEVHSSLNDAVLQTAKDIVEGVENLMVEAKTGKRYPSLPRQSSAPGEAPAVQSGITQASYDAQPDGDLRAVAFSNDANAEGMEFGTIFIAPRPALRPASEAMGQEIEHEHGKIIVKAIERVSG
jgi:hypothetical protein